MFAYITIICVSYNGAHYFLKKPNDTPSDGLCGFHAIAAQANAQYNKERTAQQCTQNDTHYVAEFPKKVAPQKPSKEIPGCEQAIQNLLFTAQSKVDLFALQLAHLADAELANVDYSIIESIQSEMIDVYKSASPNEKAKILDNFSETYSTITAECYSNKQQKQPTIDVCAAVMKLPRGDSEPSQPATSCSIKANDGVRHDALSTQASPAPVC